MSDELMRIEDLRVGFPVRTGVLRRVTRWVRAVDGVDLSIARGETLALVGESGCGKSTLGRALLRLVEPQGGRLLYGGVDLRALAPRALHPYRRKLQMVFQDPLAALDPRRSVRDIVAEGLQAFGIGANEAERTERVAALLRRVELDPDQMQRYPHEFSGGQRQRICIARALAVGPELLVCDEATSALDVSIQAQILNLLGDLQQEFGLTYLFITHDLGVVRHLADRVAVMYLGQVVEVAQNPAIFEAPRHPYTQALLSAMPRLDPARRARAIRLEGEMPSLDAPPAGCRFHPRCAVAETRCAREEPPLREVGAARSRCWLDGPFRIE